MNGKKAVNAIFRVRVPSLIDGSWYSLFLLALLVTVFVALFLLPPAPAFRTILRVPQGETFPPCDREHFGALYYDAKTGKIYGCTAAEHWKAVPESPPAKDIAQ